MIIFNRAKKIILLVVAVLLIFFGIYQIVFRNGESEFTLYEVVRGNISQEISETGQVQKGEEINLSFKISGRIKEVYVKVGDQVDSGETLAKIETAELSIQLQ